MRTLEDQYSRDAQQERFAMIVAARVNEILSNKAQALSFQPADGINYTLEQENLIFADVIARAVCTHLKIGDTQ